ncbi:MAG: hypothetical protein M1838_000628 [Thelocarpon superellum]|nr:MAG: hypothetical protein M1838_000628 [Thelocarpon superellum]
MKRPISSALQLGSSSTGESTIQAPPRAAIARERTVVDDSYPSADQIDQLPSMRDLGDENAEDEDEDAEEYVDAGDDLKLNEPHTSPREGEADGHGRNKGASGKWGGSGRAGNIANPRPARASPPGRMEKHKSPDGNKRNSIDPNSLQLNALARLAANNPGSQLEAAAAAASSSSSSRGPAAVLEQDEGDEVSSTDHQVLGDPHDKGRDDMEQHFKQRAQRYEADLNALRQEREQQEDAAAQQSQRIGMLESKLASESRDKTFWSKKHEEVHRQYLKTESEHRILQATTADRDGMWKREWERKNEHLLQERDRCRDAFHTAQRMAQDRQEEARELRRQVLELKHSISTSTRMEGQTTDDVFREKVKLLGHDLQNWTISNFRKRDIDVSDLPEPARAELFSAVPSYSGRIPHLKLNAIQAIISAILVREVFDQYFYGLVQPRVKQCQQMEEYLSSIAPSSSANQWRATTLALIRHSKSESTKSSVSQETLALHRRLLYLLSDLTGKTALSETCSKSLRSMLDQAVLLAHLFRVQRARFEVSIPSLTSSGGVKLDEESMEDISGDGPDMDDEDEEDDEDEDVDDDDGDSHANDDDDDDEDDEESEEETGIQKRNKKNDRDREKGMVKKEKKKRRRSRGGGVKAGGRRGESTTRRSPRLVKCIVFPTVVKLGDENGENLHLRNVIVKAKVFCVSAT